MKGNVNLNRETEDELSYLDNVVLGKIIENVKKS